MRIICLLLLASLIGCSGGGGGSGGPEADLAGGNTDLVLEAGAEDGPLAADAADAGETLDPAGDGQGDAGDLGPLPEPIAPGEPLGEVEISDPGQPAELRVGEQLVIRLPAGAAVAGAKLLLEGGEDPEGQPLPWRPLETYRVELLAGEESLQPAQPVELRFRVFPAQLRADLGVAEQLVIARFDEEVGHWTELPFRIEVDEGAPEDPQDDRTWAVVTSANLCSFSELLVEYPFVAMPVTGWRLLYDPSTQVSLFGVNGITAVVSKYRELLDEAYDGLVGTGLGDPRQPPSSWTTVSVYFQRGVGGSEYRWLSGNIVIDLDVGNIDEARHELAHELAHLFQNSRLNFVGMNQRRWFLEAEADYLAAAVMNTSQLGKMMDTKFFRDGLATVDGRHEYATAVLLKWLVKNKGVDLMELHKAVIASDDTVNDLLKTALEKMVAAKSCRKVHWGTLERPTARGDCTEPGDVLLNFAMWLMFGHSDAGEANYFASFDSPLKGRPASNWAEVRKDFAMDQPSVSLLSGATSGRVVIAMSEVSWMPFPRDWPAIAREVYGWRQDSGGCLLRGLEINAEQAQKPVSFSEFPFRTDAQSWMAGFGAYDGDVALVLATNECSTAVELRINTMCQIPGAGFVCLDHWGSHETQGSTCDGQTLNRRQWRCLTPDNEHACFLEQKDLECPNGCVQTDAGGGKTNAACK